MAGEIVNLRQARKARRRADKEKEAASNRARFGRSKGERLTEEAEKARRERELSGKRLDPEE